MRIKTRIQLGIILSLVLAATIALLLFLGTRAVNEASREAGIANQVVKGMAELEIVTHEYVLHPEERSLMQWRSRYDFLSETLTGDHFKSPDGKILADQIFKDLELFKTVFSDLVTGLQKRQTLGKQERVAFRELQDRLMDDLLVKSQLAVSLAFQLQQKIDAKLVTTQRRVSLLTILLLLTFTAAIVGILLWVNRSIARPIAKLEKDTQIIGSGNLDHKAGTTAKDEIGQLSRAFDEMTQDLKETTTSIVELNKEIDERKRAEDALRESEERFRTFADFTYDWEYWIAPDDHHIYVSPSCERITGYDPEAFINDPGLIEKIVHPDDHSTVVNHFGEEQSLEKLPSIDFRIITRNGEVRWISHVCQAVYGADGTHLGRRGSNRDISRRKQIEEELLKSKKLESLGVLAGGIAHEFNNALMGIMGNIELLKMDLPEDEGRDRYFEAMKGSSHRMSRLTDQLLAYARGGKYQPKNLKLDDFVIQTLSILQHDLSPEVRVETHFPKDISYIKADHAQMQMVLSAILANSNEAIEDEGLIRITAGNKDVNEDFTKQHPGLKPGPYVCLTIEDDGKGMDEETRKGIFEPFFTTKFQGRGMGMAAVYGIVKNHVGWISVESELGKGTAVQIYLPAASAESQAPSTKRLEVDSQSTIVNQQSTIQRILVMDDEEMVRNVSNALLTHLGYEVEVAVEGVEAIEMYGKAMESGKPYDLVILDLTNKFGMGGVKTIERLLEIDPDVRAIVATGYSNDPIISNFREHGFRGALPKPFSMDELKTALREVIAGE